MHTIEMSHPSPPFPSGSETGEDHLGVAFHPVDSPSDAFEAVISPGSHFA